MKLINWTLEGESIDLENKEKWQVSFTQAIYLAVGKIMDIHFFKI